MTKVETTQRLASFNEKNLQEQNKALSDELENTLDLLTKANKRLLDGLTKAPHHFPENALPVDDEEKDTQLRNYIRTEIGTHNEKLGGWPNSHQTEKFTEPGFSQQDQVLKQQIQQEIKETPGLADHEKQKIAEKIYGPFQSAKNLALNLQQGDAAQKWLESTRTAFEEVMLLQFLQTTTENHLKQSNSDLFRISELQKEKALDNKDLKEAAELLNKTSPNAHAEQEKAKIQTKIAQHQNAIPHLTFNGNKERTNTFNLLIDQVNNQNKLVKLALEGLAKLPFNKNLQAEAKTQQKKLDNAISLAIDVLAKIDNDLLHAEPITQANIKEILQKLRPIYSSFSQYTINPFSNSWTLRKGNDRDKLTPSFNINSLGIVHVWEQDGMGGYKKAPHQHQASKNAPASVTRISLQLAISELTALQADPTFRKEFGKMSVKVTRDSSGNPTRVKARFASKAARDYVLNNVLIPAQQKETEKARIETETQNPTASASAQATLTNPSWTKKQTSFVHNKEEKNVNDNSEDAQNSHSPT